jgi:hypothetical protein
VTEFKELINTDAGIQGEEVYEINLARIAALEKMEGEERRYKMRERFWGNGGPTLALAPLVAAGVIMVTPTGQNMEGMEKVDTFVYAGIAAVFTGLTAIHGYDKNRLKGQEVAVSAAPLSHALNGRMQPWIDRRLAEKAADDLRKQKRQTSIK